MSDAATTKEFLILIAGVVTFFTTVPTSVLAYLQNKAKKQTQILLIMANSEKGTMLETLALQSEALAAFANTPELTAVAKIARDKFNAHQKNQALVDLQNRK